MLAHAGAGGAPAPRISSGKPGPPAALASFFAPSFLASGLAAPSFFSAAAPSFLSAAPSPFGSASPCGVLAGSLASSAALSPAFLVALSAVDLSFLAFSSSLDGGPESLLSPFLRLMVVPVV